MKHGILLINLGTPEQPTLTAVRRYLREFLVDKRVIHLPACIRYILLYGVILPFRSHASTHAYQAIWTPQGSPLLYHSKNLCNKLQAQLGNDYIVALGMRYGKPSIQHALQQLQSCEHITILPLYPQYSSAASGSSIEKALALLSSREIFPSFTVIRDFYQHPNFIQAQAAQIQPYLSSGDYILFSYHGLPTNHLLSTGCVSECSCECVQHTTCYRAQCYQTTALLAQELRILPTAYTTAFQSRLGKTEWIKPYTEHMLQKLVSQGIQNLTVVCPSFVADCLETLEEIGMRAKTQWLALGGQQFTLIPALNDSAPWVKAVQSICTY
jgi:ferrochelatase